MEGFGGKCPYSRVFCTCPAPLHVSRVWHIVPQTRSKPVLDFLQDVVMQSASRQAGFAELKIKDPAAVHTPFAVSNLNAEMEWSKT